MLRLIQWLVLGHAHKWKTIEEADLTVIEPLGGKSYGSRYIQECKRCGIVKKRDLV